MLRAVVLVVVDPHDDRDVLVLGRRGDDDLASAGLDVGTRSNAVQDAVWSTAVQHGPTTNAITNAVRNVAAQGVTPEDGVAYDRALIDAIYAERGRRGPDGNLVYFSSSPASTQASVANRFVAERADALAMLDAAR